MSVKLSKSDVEYSDDHGSSDEQCSRCAHYVNPTTCRIVAGRINPEGWCNQFERAEDKAAAGVHYQRPIHGGSLRGAFRLPHGTIMTLANGDREAGLAVADETFGHHRALGRGVVHPMVIELFGNGDIESGHRGVA